MPGAILIFSCQKYKESRIRDLAYLQAEYEGWKVFFFIGDPTIAPEYIQDGNVITLRCEDSYLHLLKKTILGFKVALELVPDATGILKCGDDIVFNERELRRFIQSETKYDYMGIQGSPYRVPNGKHYDSWIVDYYKKHPEDFENPLHGLPSMQVVSQLTEVTTVQAASGPLTYFSRRSCDILVQHMEAIQWNVLRYSPKFGYIYIIEEPGISFVLHEYGIRPTQYGLFTESRDLFQSKPFIGLHTNSYKWACPTRVCIIGAGWYGCHAARYLKAKGVYVKLLDKEGIFAGASSKNQNRLHLGYHYPRSPETIRECEVGHTKFLKEYGECVTKFTNNFYCIHDASKTSLDQYRHVFSNQQHTEHALETIGTTACNLNPTVLRVDEKFIDNTVAKIRMERELLGCFEQSVNPIIRFGESSLYVNDIEYDIILNCTNNQYVPVDIPITPTYETVCSFLYQIPFKTPTALTIMDGPFFSIFPYDIANQLYTLTHVTHSVVSKSLTFEGSVADARKKTEADVSSVFPELLPKMKYVGYFLSNKSKYEFERDDRSLRWNSVQTYHSFSGGKITGIFEMEPILDSLIA